MIVFLGKVTKIIVNCHTNSELFFDDVENRQCHDERQRPFQRRAELRPETLSLIRGFRDARDGDGCRVAAFYIDGVRPDYCLFLSVGRGVAVTGSGQVGHLHHLHRVAPFVGLYGDGGHLAQRVAFHDPRLPAHRVARLPTSDARLLTPDARLQAPHRSATRQAQDSCHDERSG